MKSQGIGVNAHQLFYFVKVTSHSLWHSKQPLFHNVSLWGKVFLDRSASQDVVIILFGHYENCLQRLALVLGARSIVDYSSVRTVSGTFET